ncbi:hypothetical protein [Edwardsiella tarda]|uniref:hypothetical protein n=1 Tax=Edwardsiella tarda TaxID=636 RepID=UPI003B5136CA
MLLNVPLSYLKGGSAHATPSRSAFIACYGLRTVLAATCSKLMSAVIADIFFSLS